MSNRTLLPLLVVGALAIACGQSDQTASTPVDMTTTIEGALSAAPAELIEAYLVEMSNLAADLSDSITDYEEAHSPPPPEPGSEPTEPTEEPTEEELFQDQYEYWIGYFGLYLAHAEALDSVVPPPGFEAAHDEYVDGFRAYFGYVQEKLAEFSTLEDLMSFVGPAIMDPFAEPQLEELFLNAAQACEALEELGTDAGYRTDLGCPGPPS